MTTSPKDGAVFPLSDLRSRRERAGGPYVEFLRIPAMSVGFYALPAGGVDPQTPHREDEVYYVIRGCGNVTIAGHDRTFEPGETIFVGKEVEHRFHSFQEPLELLVVFAPAETPDPSEPTAAPPQGRGPPGS